MNFDFRSKRDCFNAAAVLLCLILASVVKSQSCVGDTQCEDGDVCTRDHCVAGQCVYTHITPCCRNIGECAPSASPCYALFGCFAQSCFYAYIPNCCQNASDCVGNACTTAACIYEQCGYTPITDCCRRDSECSDSDYCTDDYCVNGDCVHVPINECCHGNSFECDDGNPCSNDTCANCNTCAGRPFTCTHVIDDINCCLSSADCNDNCVFTDDTCVNNFCVHTPNGPGNCCTTNAECNDGRMCTTDTCTNGMCVHSQISGCCQTDANCNDLDACTTDTCTNHVCSHVQFPECCNSVADCNDGNICTFDFCRTTTHTCEHFPLDNCCLANSDCNDNLACTTDTCNTQTNKCSHTPIYGCCYTGTDCNDNLPCTIDLCANSTCTHTNISHCCLSNSDCDDDEDICTLDLCLQNHSCSHLPIVGCCHSNSDCSNSTSCTTFNCVSNRCAASSIPGCCSIDGQCNDNNVCTNDTCNGNTCVFTPIPGCCSSSLDCGASTICDTLVCSVGACHGFPSINSSNCEPDFNECTADVCDGFGSCIHPNKTYGAACHADDNECTFDVCDGAGNCVHIDAQNDTACTPDNNSCTRDVCVSGTCEHIIVPSCCLYDAECDDGINCTTDVCNPQTNRCQHNFFTCPFGTCGSDSDCDTTIGCRNGICNTTSHTCEDAVPYPVGCCHTTSDCPGLPCKIAQCIDSLGICGYYDRNQLGSPECDPNTGLPCLARLCISRAEFISAGINDTAIGTGRCAFQPATHICHTIADCLDLSLWPFVTYCSHPNPIHPDAGVCVVGLGAYQVQIGRTNLSCTPGQEGTCDGFAPVGGGGIYTCDPETDTCKCSVPCNETSDCPPAYIGNATGVCASVTCVSGECSYSLVVNDFGYCERTYVPDIQCDDGIGYTTDSCNPFSQRCIHLYDGRIPVTCVDDFGCPGYSGIPCKSQHCVSGFCQTVDDCQIYQCPSMACNNATGLCMPTGFSGCGDGDVCTTNYCNMTTHTCVTVLAETCDQCANRTCVDHNLCTIDGCDPDDGQCYHISKQQTCLDLDPCTDDVCLPQTGQCSYPPNCTGTSGCSSSQCSCNGTCVLEGNACDDGNECTVDTCLGGETCVHSWISGCCVTDSNCTDANQCTQDTCNTVTHVCSHTAIPSCCIIDSQCNDGNICTSDVCNLTSHVCVYAPISDCCTSNQQCDDGNACTIDFCST